MALRTVGVRLQAEVAGYMAGLRQARSATRDFVAELDKAARAGRLDAVADQAGQLGLGLVAGFGLAVAASARFEKQLSAVEAATHASASEMEQLRAAALEAGKDTAYSATEAAAAVEELAKAGVETSDILGGGLSGALDLAAAGQMEVAEAAETAASAMTQFGLAGSQVPHVADLLAAGAGKAQGSVHDMGMALNQAGLVSAQMGLSIEDTVGTLTSFASAGLLGSDAGTSLKTALLMLANPTDKAAGLMEELGIQVYDSSGQFVGITALAGQLKTQLGGLTQEQRNSALATIFGADAIRAASILYEQGADGIQTWITKVDDQGYAADTARRKTDNLIGDIERLKGELETLAIQAGSTSDGGLRWLVQAAEALVSQFGSLPPAVSGTAVALAGAAGAALLLGAGWLKARRTNAEMLTELRATGPVGERAARGMQSAQRGATRAAVAFVALQVAGAALNAMQKDLNPQIEALGTGLAEWGKSGKLAGEAARLLGEDLDDLNVGLKFLADTDNNRRQFARWGQDLLETVVPGLDGTNTSLTRTRERVEAMDQALAGLVQGGNAASASAAFQRLAEAAEKEGVSVEELRKLFPAYAAALETAGAATGKTAGQVGGLGATAAESAQEVEKLKEAFDALFGAQMSLDQATLKYHQGLADLKAELLDGKRTLDLNSQAGQDNRAAVLQQLQAIDALRQARVAHGMTLDDANAKYQREVEGLRATLLAAGYTKAAVDELLGAYLAIPDQVQTEVSAPGTAAATKNVKDLNYNLGVVPSKKVVGIWANTASANAAIAAVKAKIAELRDRKIYITGTVYWTSKGDLKVPGGTQVKRSAGGPIHGTGPKGVDSVPVLAAPGEHVLTAREVDAAGGHAAVEAWRQSLLRPAPVSYQSVPTSTAVPAASSVSPEMLAAAVRSALVGVSVQMDGRTVGYIQGREANVFARV
ncbi:phage tail tape measure protein [Micromonospora polyrhachis]|uniref:TP901 family phage tail tape measure protein n=1 Tax=Micromonospora polyrhachis TaxID=1282883 RepID=A0A7W7SQH0_9ACTN|nr:phage tail tape measure protein [Micromonospora polyrhachis]MBB4958956.1 TP901 family phage tail tape measure protein [Micromonospora polyrhachis]